MFFFSRKLQPWHSTTVWNPVKAGRVYYSSRNDRQENKGKEGGEVGIVGSACRVIKTYYSWTEKPFTGCEDIHQQIFLALFHESPALPYGVDSICDSADPLPLNLNQLPQVGSGFHETLKERSTGEYPQIHGRDFLYLLPK